MNRPVSADALSKLKAVLGPGGWSQDPGRLAAKLTPYRGPWRGETPLLVLPASTEQVSAVVAICAEHGVAITPQGGNTGLVGGQIPDGEVLISLERMRAVREVLPIEDVFVVEAGVTVLEAQQAAQDAGRLFPLSLGSEGTATIGGVISTNAGGVQVLRYGMTRDLVLGLEAVMPNGEVFHGLKRLRKDNTGYDLKQLLIGAEGTLGIVTAAALKLSPALRSTAVAFVGLNSVAQALDLLSLTKYESGGAIEAFELIDRQTLDLVLKLPGQRSPLQSACDWHVLLELATCEPDGAGPAMERLLHAAFDNGMVEDAAIAQNETQADAFWKLREDTAEAQRVAGSGWYHDVSVPISRIPAFLEEATTAVTRRWPGARVIAFGHLGDGNIHYNVVPPEGADAAAFAGERDAGARLIYEIVDAYDGSISAEHGLGVMKTKLALGHKTSLEVELMRKVRLALDPKRIMNPRVLF